MRFNPWSAAVLAGVVGAAFSVARAQDSVALTPGGNDALSSYDGAAQRVRYVVDLTGTTTSWGNPIRIGPVAKASRDIDPMFRTQILGSLAVSSDLATNLAFASRSFASWSTAGPGVHPTANSAPGSLNATGFASQFGLALSDFSLQPSSVVGATVGRVTGQFNRLYVERVVAASSRGAAGSPDTATVSLGSVDAVGDVALRADNFNTLVGTTNRIIGDNILRVNLPARSAAVNTLTSSASVNGASDGAATTYVIDAETAPTNTPTMLYQTGVGPFVLAYDFANYFKRGSNAGNTTATNTHLGGLGLTGHRGNPSFSTITSSGGNAGTFASLAIGNFQTIVTRVLVFGLNYGAGGAVPTIAGGTRFAYEIPQPISNGSFTTNNSGNASFNQYLSQTPWRGGNGQVAIGRNAANQLMLAATATDPTDGSFIAVARITSPGTAVWTVAAHPGQSVLNGASGSAIGMIPVSATFSAPAMDRLGNVYFVATWKPTLTPQEVGVFKAVNTASGYKLELILREGQTITGANSTRPYTVTTITLNDSDSIASGTMFSQSVIQQQDPGATTADPASMRAFGGLVVSALITYDNAGTPEVYDAVLYVGPAQGSDCIADFNGSGAVTVQDLFDFLAAWFAQSPSADVNNSGTVTVQDLFDFLALWFLKC